MQYALRNASMRLVGLGILALVSAKHRASGYTRPNQIAREDSEGRLLYVQNVVRSWMLYLPDGISYRDRDVLELGPGSSLGAGPLLLAHGARSYLAVDAFRLTGNEPASFFTETIDRWSEPLDASDRARAKSLASTASAAFDYRVSESFDVAQLAAGRQFDMIVSCAAFEHFNDIDKTIAQLSAVARPGCVSVHIVDFQTHSSWIRDKDPNNIYRFPQWLYRLLSFPGQPNRKRPINYRRAFEANGWRNVSVIPAMSIQDDLVGPSLSGLARPFDSPGMEMTMLHGVVVAIKA